MTETLYLVLERHRRGWRGIRISKIAKKRPTLPRPQEQALVRLSISLPDNVLEPRTVHVDIKPEHIVTPTVTAASTPA